MIEVLCFNDAVNPFKIEKINFQPTSETFAARLLGEDNTAYHMLWEPPLRLLREAPDAVAEPPAPSHPRETSALGIKSSEI